ncbi:hypothetical protein Slin14017_G020680 [Septoria linicola]|nr:hypothetical protein Slin14017_G020680 [Septoria linicola]
MPLDERREASIQNALKAYRETVFTHNISLLRILVDRINEQVPPDGADREEIRKARLRVVKHHMHGEMGGGDEVDDTLFSLHDLLSLSPTSPFAERFCLDGTSHAAVDSGAVTKAWEKLREALNLNRTSEDPALQDSEYPNDIPQDLAYLATLTSAITRPSMAFDTPHPITLYPPEEGFDAMEIYDRNEELDLLSHAFSSWTIAVAVRVGEPHPDWTPSGVFALYCSKNSGAERRDWQWRYGIHEKYLSTALYDSVEDFLTFYATFGRETAEDMQEVIVDLEI